MGGWDDRQTNIIRVMLILLLIMPDLGALNGGIVNRSTIKSMSVSLGKEIGAHIWLCEC